jgi:hypothetical protein
VADKRLEEDTLLALALGSAGRQDRRVLPDRRTGIDRRRTPGPGTAFERRSGAERRNGPRRQGEPGAGGLLAYGRKRLARIRKRTSEAGP